MKQCIHCGREYDDSSLACSIDNQTLVSSPSSAELVDKHTKPQNSSAKSPSLSQCKVCGGSCSIFLVLFGSGICKSCSEKADQQKSSEPKSDMDARLTIKPATTTYTQRASGRGQSVGLICAIINLITFFALPVLQLSIIKITMFDLCDKVGGVMLVLWIVPIFAGLYLLFYFQKRSDITPFLVKSVGGALFLALVVIILRVSLFVQHNDTNGTIDLHEAFRRFKVVDILGLGFYSVFVASAVSLLFPSKGLMPQIIPNMKDEQSGNTQQTVSIVTDANIGLRILTVEDVANRLKVTIADVTTLIESGQLKAKRIAGKWRVSEDSFNEFMNK